MDSKNPNSMSALKTLSCVFYLTVWKSVFDTFDQDGSGTVDAKEMKNVLVAMEYNPTDAQVDELIRELDKDGEC